jgi:hypothetical protein
MVAERRPPRTPEGPPVLVPFTVEAKSPALR